MTESHNCYQIYFKTTGTLLLKVTISHNSCFDLTIVTELCPLIATLYHIIMTKPQSCYFVM